MFKKNICMIVNLFIGSVALISVSSAWGQEPSGYHFACADREVYFNTDAPGGEGSAIIASGVTTEAVLTFVSSFDIYQDHFAIIGINGPDHELYFIAKSDLRNPVVGDSYEIDGFDSALVEITDPHEVLNCRYLEKI